MGGVIRCFSKRKRVSIIRSIRMEKKHQRVKVFSLLVKDEDSEENSQPVAK